MFVFSKMELKEMYVIKVSSYFWCIWNAGGGVIHDQLLASRARGPGFEPESCHFDFIVWESPLPSSDLTEIMLKRR